MPARRRAVESDAQTQRGIRKQTARLDSQCAQRNPFLDVTAVPVNSLAFTWERVHSRQCVSDVEYEVLATCKERDYFTKHAADALVALVACDHTPVPDQVQMYAAAVKDLRHPDNRDELQAVLCLDRVKYIQLLKCSAPDVSERPAPADDPSYVPEHNYEQFTVHSVEKGKQVATQYVQAPFAEGGWFAKVTAKKGLMYKVSLDFTVTDREVRVMRFEYGQRTKDGVYNAAFHNAHDCVIKITVGEHDSLTGRLVAESFVCFKNDQLAHMLFDEQKWKSDVQEDEVIVGDELDELQTSSRGKYAFCTVNDRLCYRTIDKSQGSKDLESVEVANFCIPEVLGIYQFAEQVYGELPMFNLLCRLRLKDGQSVLRITSEDKERAPSLDGISVLEVEVVLCIAALKNCTEVKAAFCTSHSLLLTDTLTPEMLSCYLNSIKLPMPTAVIMRWGKQLSGYFVVHNCAFKDGQMLSVKDSGHGIVPAHFNRNVNYPMHTSDFPRIIVIPFEHVRYCIGVKLWCALMPAFFQNNEMAAKAVFALAVLGLHADRCWNGETGVGHGMPVGWIYSSEFGSGKTEAMSLANAMLGFFDRGMWAGDATKSVMFEASSCEANMMKFIDDVVPSDKNGDGYYSRALAQQVRAFYDRTSRAVTGKIRRPYSGACYSANCTVNDDDRAFQSRLIVVPFKALKTAATENDTTLYATFTDCKKVVSALLPDMEQIGLFNGRMDKEAIGDFAQFLEKAFDKKRDRNLNEWAKLGYILANLNMLFHAHSDEAISRAQDSMFAWMMVGVTKATYELTNHSSLIDQFVIGLLRAKEVVAPNLLGPNPDKMLFWHNMRTTTLPPLYGGSATYWAVRVSSVCNVLKSILGKSFKDTDVYEAAKDSAYIVSNSRSRFYDTSKNPWPIKKTILLEGDGDQANVGFVDVPLAEDELLDCTLTEQRCIFIKTSYIDSIRASLDQCIDRNVDYRSIVVKSTRGDYNFFDALTSEGWFGYRTLTQCNFRTFCGATNLMKIDKPLPDIQASVRADGFNSIVDCFSPHVLLDFFGYEPISRDDFANLPAAYTKMPFEMRNDPEDELYEDHEQEPNSPKRAEPQSVVRPTRRAALTPVTAGKVNAKTSEPVSKKRRMRASPTNLARYPRPPDAVNSLQTAMQWAAYHAARGPDAGRASTFVLDEAEADDDDEDEAIENVCFYSDNSLANNNLTLS